MLDFLMVSTRTAKSVVEIYPKFIINNRSKDLMIRGGDFYAVWDADTGFWSTDEQDLIRLVDKELDTYADNNKTPKTIGIESSQNEEPKKEDNSLNFDEEKQDKGKEKPVKIISKVDN